MTRREGRSRAWERFRASAAWLGLTLTLTLILTLTLSLSLSLTPRGGHLQRA